MISERDTILIVGKFFNDCLNFWLKDGKEYHEAFEFALSDASKIKHDPFVPQGDLLDADAHRKCIEYIRERIKNENKNWI